MDEHLMPVPPPRLRKLIAHLGASGLDNEEVLAAMLVVDRQAFVPDAMKPYAYEDEALEIGCGQTISQPFVVARMTALAIENQQQRHVALDIGTGSGYQAAILAQLFKRVITVERIRALSQQAQLRFEEQGYTNIEVQYADGFLFQLDDGFFDAVIIAAATPTIPQNLLDQLAEGASLVAPIGEGLFGQQLYRITRSGEHFNKEQFDAVVFVPMLPGLSDYG